MSAKTDYEAAQKATDEASKAYLTAMNEEHQAALQAFRESQQRISTDDLEALLHKLRSEGCSIREAAVRIEELVPR